MKTLYVHIGTPKTGTTAIQEFCRENESLLNIKGYCYPIFPYSFPDAPKTRNGHFLVGIAHDAGIEESAEEAANIFRGGMDTVHELFEKFDNVILSDEIIWRSTHSKRKNLWKELKQEGEKGGFQVKIIVYLRSQYTFCLSWWNQLVKMGTRDAAKESFESYIHEVPKAMQLNYYGKLKKISGVLGKENVLVRRFERSAFQGGNIYADFLSVVGLSMTDEFKISQEIRNYSLEGNNCEIKRILNSLPDLDVEKNSFFLNILTDCSKVSGKIYSYDMLSEEEMDEFMSKYEEGNQRIAEEYLKEDRELFQKTVAKNSKWNKDNAYMQEDIVRFIGETSIRLLNENQLLRNEIAELRTELGEQKNNLKNLKYKLKHPVRSIWGYVKRFSDLAEER